MLARDLKSIIKTITPSLTGATLPICNCIHFADDRIWSTNLEATIEVECDIQGVVASIPLKALKALLTSIDPKDHIEVRSTEGSLMIRSLSGETTLAGLAHEELPDTKLRGTVVASAKMDIGLVDSFAAVTAAASSDQSRQVLTGVLIELSDGTVSFTATDSYRLHHDELSASTQGTSQMICPAGYVKALPGDEPASLEVTDTHIRMSEGPVTVTMRAIEGEFPNYGQLRPASTPHQAVLGGRRRSIERTLKTFERLADKVETSSVVALEFSPNEKSVDALLNLTDAGEHRCKLPLENFTGDALKVAFNPGFLRQAIAFGGMEMAMADPLKPAVLTDGSTSRYALLMPVRLS